MTNLLERAFIQAQLRACDVTDEQLESLVTQAVTLGSTGLLSYAERRLEGPPLELLYREIFARCPVNVIEDVISNRVPAHVFAEALRDLGQDDRRTLLRALDLPDADLVEHLWAHGDDDLRGALIQFHKVRPTLTVPWAAAKLRAGDAKPNKEFIQVAFDISRAIAEDPEDVDLVDAVLVLAAEGARQGWQALAERQPSSDVVISDADADLVAGCLELTPWYLWEVELPHMVEVICRLRCDDTPVFFARMQSIQRSLESGFGADRDFTLGVLSTLPWEDIRLAVLCCDTAYANTLSSTLNVTGKFDTLVGEILTSANMSSLLVRTAVALLSPDVALTVRCTSTWLKLVPQQWPNLVGVLRALPQEVTLEFCWSTPSQKIASTLLTSDDELADRLFTRLCEAGPGEVRNLLPGWQGSLAELAAAIAVVRDAN